MHWLSPLRLGVLSLFLFLTACGGGGGDSAPAVVQPQPDPASWLQGSAVNSALVGAEIKLFRFDTDGTEVEIVAGSAPVLTDADGDYKFWITGGSIDASTGPLILRSVGGTMNSAAAPKLEAVLADSSGLQADGATLTQHLSLGSSVAASLLRLQATQAAAAPSAADAAGIISLVEQQLAIGLDQDPSDPTQPLAIYAQSVDENLGLSQTPDNAPAVNEFIDYLALNLNSDSGQLDNTMQDPATGLMVPASFNNIGSGLLASLVPQGPASFQTVKISLDKREIENDGMDTAFLTASLVDGTGAPVADGTVVMYENTAGRVVINKNRADTMSGKSRVNISSVWSGDAQVTVLYEGANSELKSIPVNLSVVDKVDDVPDTVPPKVSSAGATSNTQILVSFSEAMRGGMDGAENPSHYRISGVEPLLSQKTSVSGSSKLNQSNQVNAKPEARVIAAELILPDRNTVRLTTLSQSDLLYAVRVVNLTDVNGNGMSAGEQFDTDPTRAEFQGIAPSGAEIVDTDGDGLSDSDEQRGWIVSTVSAAGVVLTFEVTSDPLNADTDGDGVTDNEEFHGAFNPRSADSDGDTLTDNQEWNVIYSDPTNQDTDGDGTQDGFEFYSFRTSPVLADTDGDQISDTDEVLGRNRDPRISDLPLHGINIGDVRLQIDERYTYEDALGNTVTTDSSSNVTLTHGESQSKSFGGSGSVEAMYEAAGGTTIETTPKPFSSSKVGFSVGAAIQISSESATESQRVREQSIGKAREISTNATVTREIVGARIDADLTIQNRGDLAFTISNLEVTVLQRSRESSRRFIPVGTLIANSALISGQPASFSLGPFTPERGPIVFTSRDVFPNLIDEMMQLPPGGLVFEVVNYDITDEFGRVFTFSNQIARDRTGGIVVDAGDGEIRRTLIATALQPDPDGYFGGGFVGGFNPDGSPKGLPIDFALQDVMELQKNSTVPDGIVAGLDQTANSIAQGDDIQVIPPGTTGVSVGSIVIEAGQNGVLDSIGLGDDQVQVTTGYETSLTCNVLSLNARQICSSDSQCFATTPGGGLCNGPETLVRLGSLRTGDFDRQWVVLTNGQLPAGAEFGDLTLQPGKDIYFAFVQDLDQDGIFAREEFLNGSVDSSVDQYVNASFGQIGALGANGFELIPPTLAKDGQADSKDTDRDGLGDFAEVRVGWKVSADGGLLAQVFPSPRLADSDGDGLLDPQEQDLRSFCNGPSDPRVDGLCRYLSNEPVSQSAAVAIIAGLNGSADTLAIGDDQQLVTPGVQGLTYSTQIVGPGQNGVIDTPLGGANEYQSVQSSLRIPPATNPIISDTDVDAIDDFSELTGIDVGLSIRDGGNESSDTRAMGDDIQQTFFGGPVSPGGIVVLPGPNGTLESIPAGDDRVAAVVRVETDPLRRDTDTDLVADGRERDQGGDPTNPADGAEFRDSDQDGLSDTEESVLGWLVSTNGLGSRLVLSNPSRPDSDFDGLPDLAERVLRTDPNNPDTDGDGIRDFDEIAGTDFEQFFGLDEQFPNFFIDGDSSRQFGTNPNRADTDFDGINDYDELLVGYRVLLGGEPTFRQVYTNPLVVDTDLDGLPDLTERSLGTDATDPDTDDDGRSDGVDRGLTNPLVPDVGITVTYKRLNLDRVTDVGGSGGAEIHWFFMVKRPGDRGNGLLLSSAGDCLFNDPECGFADEPDFPDPNGRSCQQFQADPAQYYTLPLGLARVNPFGPPIFRFFQGQASFVLREGQSFSVNGIIFEADAVPGADCGLPPFYIPTGIPSGCVTRFDETFRYEDFQDGGQATFPFPNGAGTAEQCDWTVEVEVESN